MRTQAVFARVRTNGAKRTLQCKFDEPGSDKQHISCTERAFVLTDEPLPEGVHAIFAHFLPTWQLASSQDEVCTFNHLEELTRILNTRHLYYLEDMTLCLDHVQDVGVFIEVEMLCEEGADTQEVRARVRQFVEMIGVAHSRQAMWNWPCSVANQISTREDSITCDDSPRLQVVDFTLDWVICGLVMDRDENSAVNILTRYLARRGHCLGTCTGCWLAIAERQHGFLLVRRKGCRHGWSKLVTNI